jgi:5'-3' exonuclease
MANVSLIFDGNYFFYKTLFIFGGYSGNGGKTLESQQDQEMFIRKIATDMTHAIRAFGNPSRIIFTIDSKSWRKEIEIEDGGYKTNRDKGDSPIDWDSFYKCMNEFAIVLKKKGFIVSKEERAEGDDLMFLWADELYKNGEDSIIITGDKDLTQCVKCNGKNYVVVYNPNSKSRKLVAPKGFTEWLKAEEYDLFDASTFMNRSKDLIAEAANSVPVEEIDEDYLIFEKVIIGDAGDTVPPIWTWENKGKTFRITPAKAARIYEIVNAMKPIGDIYELPNRATEISNAINAVCKQIAPAEVLKPRIERNLKLVYLNQRIIPESIVKAWAESYSNDSPKMLSAHAYDMNYILEGTRFISAGRTFEADIFSKFK